MMRWHNSGQSCIRPCIGYLPFAHPLVGAKVPNCGPWLRSCIGPFGTRNGDGRNMPKLIGCCGKANSLSALKITISQNSFHYCRPCSNHANPHFLAAQQLNCAGGIRVKVRAATTLLLLAVAVATALTSAAAQTSRQTGASSSRARSGPSTPPRSTPLVLPEQFAPPQEVYASFPDSPAAAAG